MAGRTVLFGATGYTGRLTAEQMVARGMSPVLAARDAGRLESLSGELGGLETAVADVSRPETVAALVGEGDVLVSTVGPFARWGGPALDAAIGAGAHYIDSTGEPAFIRRVFEREGTRAEASGSVLLTALGYDWVPGNLAGALALQRAGDAAHRVRIGYFMRGRGGMSGGTRASSAGAFLEPQFAYREGRLVTERGGARVASFAVGGRQRQALSVGSSEHFGLPAAFPSLREVDVYLGWFGGATRALSGVSLAMSGLMKVPGAKGAADAAFSRFVKGSTGGPGPEERAKGGSEFIAEALAGDGTVLAQVRLAGVDGYTFTGGMLAWAAENVSSGSVTKAGALGPVEAFGVEALEAGVAEAGITLAS